VKDKQIFLRGKEKTVKKLSKNDLIEAAFRGVGRVNQKYLKRCLSRQKTSETRLIKS